jgi:hypothetical protein
MAVANDVTKRTRTVAGVSFPILADRLWFDPTHKESTP